MKRKKFDAVEMKRKLQNEAEQKLANLTEREQIEFLSQKFGYLKKHKRVAPVA